MHLIGFFEQNSFVMAKSSPSLRDVAQAAGVSVGTASRALNNKANVLPSTRSQVLKAAANLGYMLQFRVPTAVASRINTVGVVVKRDPGELRQLDPFYYAVVCGVENECERLGLNLLYTSLPVDEFSHATTWLALAESGVDGLVIVGVVLSDPAVTASIPQHIPVVMVDATARGIDCDTIITDNQQGAYSAVSYLIEQGHRRIGLIGSTQGPEHPGIRERRLGYVRALSDRGISLCIEDSLLHGDSAYAATRRLLARCPDITAIFACNDDTARHVIRAAREAGRRVPEDVSVVGFDDTIDAVNALPPLTTVQVEKELMGEMAVRQLYERSARRDRPPITLLVGTRLIVRESVLPCTNRPGGAAQRLGQPA